MRLSTDEDRDEERARETIAAAAEAGITAFDTARAYGAGEDDRGHNERLLAAALRACGAEGRARVVTKGGMSRTGGAWLPDGRAKAIRADCEASLMALDGLPIDLYVLHAPDPRTPWRTSVRALARLREEGLVARVGVANVNLRQLDEAHALAPIAAAQVALSVFDDRALRGGVVERCEERGIVLVAHSPLGGPRRAGRLEREQVLVSIAKDVGATAAQVALAWLLQLSASVVAIPGARRPETARGAAIAGTLPLSDEHRATLERSFGALQRARRRVPKSREGEVVLVMGVPGAGKSRLAAEYVERGYFRLNRDDRGGSLRELDQALNEQLSSGARRVVLDNTYLTRSSRSHPIEIASRHGLASRCIWLEIPLAQAQVNVVERLLERFGELPTPEELPVLARREPGVHTPTTQMRTFRQLEPPSTDEGFAAVEQVPFTRSPAAGTSPGVVVAAPALAACGWEDALDASLRDAPHLVFDWSPHGTADELHNVAERLRMKVTGSVEVALCPHGAGPPVCWCRPPLPGLPLAFARAHDVDLSRSLVIGSSPAHRTLATALAATFVQVATVD